MRIFQNIALLISLIAAFSCQKQEADIFPDSPMVRLNEALKTNTALLQSAENGWAMEYFATTESPGYTLFVKFKNNGEAVFSAKNDLTKNRVLMDSSVYKTIGDNGPVLTFNTYNIVLHAFSNPVNPDGYGLEGDYEFIIMQSSADTIVLQGKKRATTILLTKIPTTISWSNYRTALEDMNTLLFANDAPDLSLQLTDKYIFSEGASHVFQILKENSELSSSFSAPFIVTRSGIRFHSPVEFDGRKSQIFDLSADKSALISRENAEIKLTTSIDVGNLSNFLITSPKVWKYDADKSSPKANQAYNLLVKSCNERFASTSPTLKVKEVALNFSYMPTTQLFALQLSVIRMFTQLNGEVYLSSTPDLNTISMLYNESGDENGMRFYDNSGGSFPSQLIGGYKEMVDVFSQSFTLSTEQSINPRSLKFVSKTDETLWFTVTCNSLVQFF